MKIHGSGTGSQNLPTPCPLVGNVERFQIPEALNFYATAIYESTFGFNRTEVAEGVPQDMNTWVMPPPCRRAR